MAPDPAAPVEQAAAPDPARSDRTQSDRVRSDIPLSDPARSDPTLAAVAPGAPVLLDRAGLQGLLDALHGRGFDVVGPTVRDGAIVYDRVRRIAELPAGWTDRQDAGRYRLERRDDNALFGYAVGPQSWKRFLHPPIERLWQRAPAGRRLRDHPRPPPPAPFAFLGVRACEVQRSPSRTGCSSAEQHQRPGLSARREGLHRRGELRQAGGTCFCVSMDTGPSVGGGFDLALTELIGPGQHRFLVEAGSAAGAALLATLPRASGGGAGAAKRPRRSLRAPPQAWAGSWTPTD